MLSLSNTSIETDKTLSMYFRSRICIFISCQSLMSKCERDMLCMPNLSKIQQIAQAQCKLNLEPGDIHTCFHAGSLGTDLHPT